MELRVLEPFALAHNGLVTRRVLARPGIPDRSWYRAVARGLLDLLHPGVARLAGSPRTSTQRIHAAVLAAGSGAMASHRSAIELWGFVQEEWPVVDVLLPSPTRKATLAGAIVHRPRDLLDLTPSRRNLVPVTNILRTLCDLGAVEPGAVPAAVGHVVTAALVSPAALRAAVRRHGRRGRPGVPALRAALDEWELDGKPVDSVLEAAMCHLLTRHGLPPAQFHASVGGYEVDFLIRDSPVVLECDGWTTHGLQRTQFQRDRSRDTDLASLGYIVLRFTYRDIVTRPARTAERIRHTVLRWAPHLLAA